MNYIKSIAIMLFMFFSNIQAKENLNEILRLESISTNFEIAKKSMENNPKFILYENREIIFRFNGKEIKSKLTEKEFQEEMKRIEKIMELNNEYLIEYLHQDYSILNINLNGIKKEIAVNGILDKNYIEKMLSFEKKIFGNKDKDENIRKMLIKNYWIPNYLLDTFIYYENYGKNKIMINFLDNVFKNDLKIYRKKNSNDKLFILKTNKFNGHFLYVVEGKNYRNDKEIVFDIEQPNFDISNYDLINYNKKYWLNMIEIEKSSRFKHKWARLKIGINIMDHYEYSILINDKIIALLHQTQGFDLLKEVYLINDNGTITKYKDFKEETISSVLRNK